MFFDYNLSQENCVKYDEYDKELRQSTTGSINYHNDNGKINLKTHEFYVLKKKKEKLEFYTYPTIVEDVVNSRVYVKIYRKNYQKFVSSKLASENSRNGIKVTLGRYDPFVDLPEISF